MRAPAGSLLVLSSLIAQTAFAQVPDAPGPAEAPDAGARPSRFTETPVVSAPSGTPEEKLKWLKGQVDAALGDPLLAAAKIGFAITDIDSGRILYGKNESALFNPASDSKLVTTAAALATLGPEYRWKTVVYTDGTLHAGVIDGKLYLKGHGDPTLVIEDLWRIVSDLWSMGVRKVSGDLVVDDTFFDDVRLGPGFEQKSEDLPFRAPNGALSLNYNAVGVHVLPGPSDGAPARIVIDPQTPYFTVINEARTVAAGRTLLTVESKDSDPTLDGSQTARPASDAQNDHTWIVVRGRIRAGDLGQLQLRRVAHPDLYTAHAFRELCSKRGIKLSGELARGATPAGARALTAHYSQPLGVAVRDVNKRSNNFMAEQILKTLGAETVGRPGTWQKGLDAVAGFLEKLGIAKSEYKMVNGSGLYDSNRFTPSQLTRLLATAYKDFRWAADFIGSLAVAGADGTVSHRMEGGLAERYVRAKTGTLQGVSCLAGYAGAPGRPPLAFAIFMNNVADPATATARRAQDQIAEALVAYLLAR